MNKAFVSSLAVALSGLILAPEAIAQSGVKTYRVPKEAASSRPAGLVAVSESVLPGVAYETPKGWTELPAGQMRVASFKVQADGKVADVSVIPLPGVAGGDVPNVNRWRGQVGLPEQSEEQILAAATKLEIAGQPALLHEMAGKPEGSSDATRILGAIQHRDGMAWFFKMTGEDVLVGRERAAFLELLKSVKFVTSKPGASAMASATPGAELPPGHPPVGNAGSTPAPPPKTESKEDGKLNWTVPAGWKEIPGGQFLYAKFSITGASGATAAVNVSTSAGDGGGLAANVNRWRGQLGLPSWTDAELGKEIRIVESGGNTIQFVEMSGTDPRTGQGSAVVGATVFRKDAAWFYKLMGEAALVTSNKDEFSKFVTGVRY